MSSSYFFIDSLFIGYPLFHSKVPLQTSVEGSLTHSAITPFAIRNHTGTVSLAYELLTDFLEKHLVTFIRTVLGLTVSIRIDSSWHDPIITMVSFQEELSSDSVDKIITLLFVRVNIYLTAILNVVPK
jgi:hypothetical protein